MPKMTVIERLMSSPQHPLPSVPAPSLNPKHYKPASLDLAREVIGQARKDPRVGLESVGYDGDALSAMGRFVYPRAPQSPNIELTEITGGQLLDSAAQMGYVLTGLGLNDGAAGRYEHVVSVGYSEYLNRIYHHLVNFSRMDLTFSQAATLDKPLLVFIRSIAERLKGRVPQVAMSVVATQDMNRPIYYGQIAACCRAPAK